MRNHKYFFISYYNKVSNPSPGGKLISIANSSIADKVIRYTNYLSVCINDFY
ncbi:MAG: hypothetical protein ACHQIM_06655 [Sphingobacteriales bacterium]